VFVDTGAFVGALHEDDKHHARAVTIWERLKSRPYALYTSDLVIAETVTVLAREAGFDAAVKHGRVLLETRRVGILRPDLLLERGALERMKNAADRKDPPSYVDCVSFAVMAAFDIPTAFTFDRALQDGRLRGHAGRRSIAGLSSIESNGLRRRADRRMDASRRRHWPGGGRTWSR